MSGCQHDFVEPVEHERTGDLVSQCCNCDDVLGLVRSPQHLPDHWFDNPPFDHPHWALGADLLNGRTPPRPDEAERYVRICGNCQHWCGAVHGRWFESATEPLEDSDAAFAETLSESLCPKCGAALFRGGCVIMAHCDAVWAEKEGVNLTRYVKNRANGRFWSAGSSVMASDAQIEREHMRCVNYEPRCPCCGYADAYGDREFDFHHWDYEDDRGCMLCRDCHSHIHRETRVAAQDEMTGDWRRDAAERLHERATDHGLEFDTWQEFQRRFNIRDIEAPQRGERDD